jgi:hypothetical protein
MTDVKQPPAGTIEAEKVIDRSLYIPKPEVPKGACGALQKEQNAVCILPKDHEETKHQAVFPSSGPEPSRFYWPKS